MERQLETYQKIERSIIKKFRKQLWTPFIVAVKRYELIQAGAKIAVCISGGKDSMLMAKLLQELQRHSEVPFELVYLVMDPGYNEINRQKIESNAALLHIPITVFETNIFDVANNSDKSPCYLCARMRRGHLYKKAQELGCNKIALGHHFNDVIETTVMSMFYGSQLQAMPFYRGLHDLRQRRRRLQASGGQGPAAPPDARQPEHRKQHLPQHPRCIARHNARLQVRGCGAFVPGAV